MNRWTLLAATQRADIAYQTQKSLDSGPTAEWHVVTVRDSAQVVERASGEDAPDAILLDLTPDGGAGDWETVLDRISAAPVVVLVEPDDHAQGLAAMRAGAQDVVLSTGEGWRELGFVLEKAVLRSDACAARVQRENSQLSRRLDLFQELAESLPQLVWALLPGGIVEYYNRRVRSIGLPETADLAQVWKTLVHPDDVDITEAMWQKTITTGEPYQVEHRVHVADGTYHWHLTRTFPVRNTQGEVVRWYGTATDIDEQKRTEQALRSSRALVQQQLAEIEAIYDTAPVGLCFLDTDLRYVRVNERMAAMNGTPAKAHLGRSVREIVPDVAAAAEPLFHRVIDTGEPILGLELAGETAAQPGVRRIWEENFLPLKDDDGHVIGVNVVADEITGRRLADRQLRHYAMLFQFVWDAILSVDRDYHIQSWNRAAELIYGWTAEEVQGKVMFDVLQSRYPYHEREDVIRQLEDQGRWHGEVIHLRKDGTPIFVLAAKTMLFDENGERIGMVAVNHDITERKRAEEHIHDLNTTLERRVQERTAQLMTLNQEIEAFSYTVSHDLRTPLRALDGFSQVLLEDYHDRLDEEGQYLLDRIRTASQRMGHLIDDMLRLSRLSRGEIRHEPVNLSALAQDVIADLRSEHPQRQVEVIIEPDLAVQGDPRLLGVLLENLLSNAWKFTRSRDPARIEFGRDYQDDRAVYFVRDNGVGFNDAFVGKLFTAFQRLHSEAEFEGNGIGLATVQRIVHRHGGQVWAEGEIDMGATFSFTLS
ncbi:PAS domain-containing protein [Aggregatilinea lenta]|uniref:PAS domain-containing protein n=1 Tax=Aggregatilinea lenta TaxID=913108 RepID=UPI0013C33692|nr:PAS domain-containing protein [Aggregatilinea lenta]